MTEPEYLGLREACAITSPPIPLGTIKHWVLTGRLRRCGPGKRAYVKRSDLVALIEGGR